MEVEQQATYGVKEIQAYTIANMQKSSPQFNCEERSNTTHILWNTYSQVI
jgi:hypothetical protein